MILSAVLCSFYMTNVVLRAFEMTSNGLMCFLISNGRCCYKIFFFVHYDS